MASVKLPTLRADQRAIVVHKAKRKNASMGRRFGKTVVGGVVVANVLRQHGRAAWTTPTYKNNRPLWQFMMRAFYELIAEKTVQVDKADRVMTTRRGGFFAMYSAENIDAVRGDNFHVVVNDEAAKLSEAARFDAIEALVFDTDGDIIDISTPRGRNWFWRQHEYGKTDTTGEYASFHAPTSANPMPAIQRAYERAKLIMPADSFAQEFDALFLEDGASVFRKLSLALRDDAWKEEREEGHHYVAGIDWALDGSDWTVVFIIDLDTSTVVHYWRDSISDTEALLAGVCRVLDKWRPEVVVGDKTGLGAVLNDLLILRNYPVEEFIITNMSKGQAVGDLVVAFDSKTVRIPDDPNLMGELQAYERGRTPGGAITYSAPEPLHDDIVTAFWLAWSVAKDWVPMMGPQPSRIQRRGLPGT